MQNFERFPKLAEYIERLANTDCGLVLYEWDNFLAALNEACASSEASRINADHFLVIMEECGLKYEGTPFAAVQTCKYLEGKRELP